jgi:purine-binding chemotaxis protein CheW
MNQDQEIFCFKMDNQRYGFPLHCVDRFLQATTVKPVPNSPPLIHGLIDYFGSLIPVINFRHRLKLPEKRIRINDYFVIVDTPKRKLAIVIDDVEDVIIPSANEIIQASSLDPSLDNMGFLRREDGIIFIYDLETFISSGEEEIMQGIIDTARQDISH